MNVYDDVFASLKLVDEFTNKGETSKAVQILDTIEQKLKEFENDEYYADWLESVLDVINDKRDIIIKMIDK